MSTRIAWKRFGQLIYDRRVELGHGIREVAKELRISPATVSRADRGLVVSADTFMVLAAKYLNADPRSFLK